MTDSTRRDFLRNLGLAAGAGALAPALGPRRARAASLGSGGPLILDGAVAAPAAVSSANGLPAVRRVMEVVAGGGSVLEGVVAGVNLVEEDPEDMTVGYGGLPNADGVVQLDSQVWNGPTRGAGAVAALEGFVHPSRVAVAVMRYTDHVMLGGEGAADERLDVAPDPQPLWQRHGDLVRRRFLEWRAGLSDDDDYLTPEQSGEEIGGFDDPGGPGAEPGGAARNGPLDEETLEAGLADSHDGVRPWGTIHCSAVGPDGEMAAVTTTSGLFFKVPGRVGDSPLPGCGCYCDGDVGAAGATGRGEAVIKTVGAHLIVEEMRRGAAPTDACLTALRRIVDWTVEDRLLTEDGRPDFNVRYYAVNRAGEHGGASIWGGGRHAVHEGGEARLVDSAYLFEARG